MGLTEIPIEDSAKVVLSGEYSRRRGYLTSVIAGLNGLAFVATLSIWSFFVHWDALIGEASSQKMFATQIAWAGSLSSLLIGLWQFYVRSLDSSIIQLYPAIYICERSLIPKEACSIKIRKLSKKVKTLSKKNISDGVEWVTVHNKDFGGRGHRFLDWLAITFILAFGCISIGVAYHYKVITIVWLGTPDWIGLLLLGNFIGLIFIISGWLRWRNGRLKWPIPKDSVEKRTENTA